MGSPWEVQASNSGGTSEAPPEGNHPAVLIGLIDLGTHEDEYQGKQIDNRKVLFCWELVGECDSKGAPFVVAHDYNLMTKISGKSKLRLMLEAWRGKPMADGETVDLSVLLGRSCLINIGHATSSKGSTYGKILGISPPIKGMNVPKPLNDLYTWHFGAGEFNPPDWVPYLYGRSVSTWIEEAKESGGSRQPVGAGVAANGTGDDDSDIPF